MFFLGTHAPFHVADMFGTCTDDVDGNNNVQVQVWGGICLEERVRRIC